MMVGKMSHSILVSGFSVPQSVPQTSNLMHSGPLFGPQPPLLELDLDVAARRVSEHLLCVIVEVVVLQPVATGA